MLADAPSELAAELWLCLRRVHTWLGTPAERRGEGFSRRHGVRRERQDLAPVPPALVEEMSLLARLGLPAPASVPTDAQVGAACHAVAEWAIENGYVETGIQFAETAARLTTVPEHSLLAGRLTRNQGEHGRAELWFQRGIAAAHAQENAVAFIRGHLGYGILCMSLRRDQCARKHFQTASVYAMQEGYEWLAAEAQHDLFHFMALRGNLRAAEMYARRALRSYPKHHPRFPFFAMDVAYLIICRGHNQLACRVLREALRVVERPTDTVLGVSLYIRALAGAGQVKERDRQTRRLEALLAQEPRYEAAARWHLAEAQRAAGLFDDARANAARSLDMALTTHDAEIEQFARELLKQLERQSFPAPLDERNEDHEGYSHLVGSLVARVREWSPKRRGRLRSLAPDQWVA